MLEVLTRSRGSTAVQHWAEDFAERTLCGRHLVEARLPTGAVVSSTRACPGCAARRQDAVLRETLQAERRSRGIWRTRNRTTGKLDTILVADMADTHLVSAIALCRRRATEFGFLRDAERDAFIRGRWQAYDQICAEAQRRFPDVWESMVQARLEGSEVLQQRMAEVEAEKAGAAVRSSRRAIRVREET